MPRTLSFARGQLQTSICKSGNLERDYQTAFRRAAGLPITDDSDILECSSSWLPLRGLGRNMRSSSHPRLWLGMKRHGLQLAQEPWSRPGRSAARLVRVQALPACLIAEGNTAPRCPPGQLQHNRAAVIVWDKPRPGHTKYIRTHAHAHIRVKMLRGMSISRLGLARPTKSGPVVPAHIPSQHLHGKAAPHQSF